MSPVLIVELELEIRSHILVLTHAVYGRELRRFFFGAASPENHSFVHPNPPQKTISRRKKVLLDAQSRGLGSHTTKNIAMNKNETFDDFLVNSFRASKPLPELIPSSLSSENGGFSGKGVKEPHAPEKTLQPKRVFYQTLPHRYTWRIVFFSHVFATDTW